MFLHNTEVQTAKFHLKQQKIVGAHQHFACAYWKTQNHHTLHIGRHMHTITDKNEEFRFF